MRNTHFNGEFVNAQDALRNTHPAGKMRSMNTGQKIRSIRLAKKLKLAEVEHAAGIAGGNLSRVERGKQWLNEENLYALAMALGVQVGDFFTEDLFDASVSNLAASIRAIPVISPLQAGGIKEGSAPHAPGDGFDLIYADNDVSRSAFAFEIEGDSMMPEFRPGDRVIIDPDLRPHPGDFVVAKNGGEEATFKKYRPRAMDANGKLVFELSPLNEDYPTLRSDLQDLRIIGVMVEHRKRYRRR